MNTSTKAFFDSVKGKTVAFIGIGTSNLPLIKQFADKGANVVACDRKSFEALGENGVKAKEYGAQLLLGDDYLQHIEADIVFRSPGTPFYKARPPPLPSFPKYSKRRARRFTSAATSASPCSPRLKRSAPTTGRS